MERVGKQWAGVSGLIGSKIFVDRIYQDFKHYFSSKHQKKPRSSMALEESIPSEFMEILMIIGTLSLSSLQRKARFKPPGEKQNGV